MNRLQAILGTRRRWSTSMKWSIISLASPCVSLDAFDHVASVERWTRVVFDEKLDRFGPLATNDFTC